MIILTLLIILLQFLIATTAPVRFIYLSLWIQTIPYTWNWDAQLVFETPIGPLNVVAMQMFGFLLASSWVVFTNFTKITSRFSPFKLHLGFLLFCLVSVAYAPSISYGFRMIAKLVAPFMFMLAAVAMINTREEMKNAERAIIGSGVILISLALLAKLMGIQSDPNAIQTGRSGLGPPSMGPPVFSAHMLVVAMLAMANFITARKALSLFFLLICIVCILAAYQRTSAAAMYFGFTVILFVGTRGFLKFLLPVVGVAALPALIIFSDSFRQRMFFGGISSDQVLADPVAAVDKINGSGRFSLWQMAMEKFFYPHPVQGAGIGATQEYLYSLSKAGGSVVHSEYVRLICEVGILGLVLFSLTMIFYLVRFATGLRSMEQHKYSLAALGSLVAYLTYCATDNGLDYVTQFGAYVFCLVALAFNERNLSAADHEKGIALAYPPSPYVFSNLLR